MSQDKDKRGKQQKLLTHLFDGPTYSGKATATTFGGTIRNWTRWRYITKDLNVLVIVGGDDSWIIVDGKDQKEFERRISYYLSAKTPLCLGLEEVKGLTDQHLS